MPQFLTTKVYLTKQFESIGNWSAWLAEGDPVDDLSIIRRNIEKVLPCGSNRFIKKLEGGCSIDHLAGQENWTMIKKG
jgi:hypothetical protein